MTEQEYMTLKRRYKAEAEEAERLIEADPPAGAEAAHTPENLFLAAFGSFRGADVLTKEMAQALIERVCGRRQQYRDRVPLPGRIQRTMYISGREAS